MNATTTEREWAKVVKAYQYGILTREEVTECLERKHGLTAAEAVAYFERGELPAA